MTVNFQQNSKGLSDMTLGLLALGAMCLLLIVVGLAMDKVEGRNRDDDMWED